MEDHLCSILLCAFLWKIRNQQMEVLVFTWQRGCNGQRFICQEYLPILSLDKVSDYPTTMYKKYLKIVKLVQITHYIMSFTICT
jgi:hypothetical protein